MIEFTNYLEEIPEQEHREKLVEIFLWITENYPMLERKIAWKQPMFIHKGTFIIGFSVANAHIAIAPEQYTLNIFMDEIIKNDYNPGKMFFRIKWQQTINYDLLAKIINFNLETKADCPTFWRKK